MVVDIRTRLIVSGSESVTISPFITTSDAMRRTEVNLAFDGSGYLSSHLSYSANSPSSDKEDISVQHGIC